MALILDESFATDPGAGFATLRSNSGTFTATYNAGALAYDLSNSGATSSNLWDLTSLSYYSKGEFEVDIESIANFATPVAWDSGIHLLNGVSGNITNGYIFSAYQNAWYVQQNSGTNAWLGTSTFLTLNSLPSADSLFGANKRVILRAKWDSTASNGNTTIEYYVNDKKIYSQVATIVSLRPAVYFYAGTIRVHQIKVWDDLVTPMEDNSLIHTGVELAVRKSPSITNASLIPGVELAVRKSPSITNASLIPGVELSLIRTQQIVGPTKIGPYYDNLAKVHPGSNGTGTIYGTVKIKGAPNYPVSRKVRIIEESDSRLVNEMYSSSFNGEYEFGNLDQSKSYTLITYDHTGVYNAAVASGMYARNLSNITGNDIFSSIGVIGYTSEPA
jgi:hypothetical protein